MNVSQELIYVADDAQLGASSSKAQPQKIDKEVGF